MIEVDAAAEEPRTLTGAAALLPFGGFSVVAPSPRLSRPSFTKETPLGDLTEVRWLEADTHPVQRRRGGRASPAQRAGHAFQRRVESLLRNYFARDLANNRCAGYFGVWIEYRCGDRLRYAQPDAVVVFPDRIFLYEVKLSSTLDAFFQLTQLYGPLLRGLYPERRLHLINVVKHFNPDVRFPAPWPLHFDFLSAHGCDEAIVVSKGR